MICLFIVNKVLVEKMWIYIFKWRCSCQQSPVKNYYIGTSFYATLIPQHCFFYLIIIFSNSFCCNFVVYLRWPTDFRPFFLFTIWFVWNLIFICKNKFLKIQYICKILNSFWAMNIYLFLFYFWIFLTRYFWRSNGCIIFVFFYIHCYLP